MSWDLTNKIVVITGGGHGIGYEIGDRYLQYGAKIIIILDINETFGVQSVQQLTTKYGDNRAVFLKCDITTDVEDVSKKIFNSYAVDVLINSAGVFNEVVPRKAIDINLTGTIELSFKFWQHMRKDKGGNGGTIVNIASTYGYRTDQFFPAYQASKHGIVAFTRSLGHVINYERSGVRVITICPGPTESGIPTDFVYWNEGVIENLEKYSESMLWQKVDVVGDAAVEVYNKARTGTAWVIEGAKPIFEI